MGGACSTYERRRAYKVLVERPERKNRFEDPGVDGSIRLNRIFKKCDGEPWAGLLCLRKGTGGARLWMREWTFGFHKMRGIFWLAKDLLALSGRALLQGVDYSLLTWTTSETFAPIYRTTRCPDTEGHNVNLHCCVSYIFFLNNQIWVMQATYVFPF